MSHCKAMRRLPLEGAPNTRDLGGYPCKEGHTRWGRFLRSAGLSELSPADIEYLREFGLTTVVDLRSQYEREHMPSKLEGQAGITVHSVPLLDQVNSTNYEGDLPGTMSGLYISLLDTNRAEMQQIFTCLADAQGVALFHCTAGKDRTGVVAMLLLNLAGVHSRDIVADYAVTEIYMQRVFATELKQRAEIPQHVLRSLPESMERVLLHLEETYQNAENYLKTIGLPAEKLAALKQKMIQPCE